MKDVLQVWKGDSNLDGEFNSRDLVDVFKAGEYADHREQNSGWRTGDWNADREFDSSDLVAAFEDGGYDQGPREVLSIVPEPNGIAMMTIALVLATVSSSRRSGHRS